MFPVVFVVCAAFMSSGNGDAAAKEAVSSTVSAPWFTCEEAFSLSDMKRVGARELF